MRPLWLELGRDSGYTLGARLGRAKHCLDTALHETM